MVKKENWQEVVMRGIEELPQDLKNRVVACRYTDESLFIDLWGWQEWEKGLSVVRKYRLRSLGLKRVPNQEPFQTISLTWWDTHREELDDKMRQEPDIGIEGHLKIAKERGSLDWPVIEIDNEGFSCGLFANRVDEEMLKAAVREEIESSIPPGQIDEEPKGHA